MAEPSDTELIQGCLNGAPDAWAQLTDRYLRLVVGVARRTGLASDQADDVAQETFLVLWRNLRRVREGRALGGWLATTSRRRAWRLMKRDHARTVREAGPRQAGPAPAPVPDAALLEEERRQLVRTAFRRLGERCRRLLDALFFRVEAPYADISEETGIPIGSIGPTRRRCLAKLRASLEADGFGADDVSAPGAAASPRVNPSTR